MHREAHRAANGGPLAVQELPLSPAADAAPLCASHLNRAPELDRFKLATANKLAGLRCPVHRQAPRLRFDGASLREVTISLSGCCPMLMALANRAIAAH